MALDTVAPRPEWRYATTAMGGSPRAFRAGVGAFFSNSSVPPGDTTAASIAQLLRQHRARADYRAALSVLAKSHNYRDRAVAAVLVTHFPDERDTWAALLDAMRESDGAVKELATQGLRVVATKSGRAPNWAGLASRVHPRLDGTSLFVLEPLIALLAGRPEIGPALARPFLAAGGEMLVDFAESDQPARAAPARALLTKLRGSDLGPSGGPWREWINGLKRYTLPNPALLLTNADDLGSVRCADAFYLSARSRTRFR